MGVTSHWGGYYDSKITVFTLSQTVGQEFDSLRLISPRLLIDALLGSQMTMLPDVAYTVFMEN